MAIIQGSVRTTRSDRFMTKKELAAAVKANPATVIFDCNSPMGAQFNGPLNRLNASDKLVIVGPSPYERKWYANISRTVHGFKVT